MPTHYLIADGDRPRLQPKLCAPRGFLLRFVLEIHRVPGKLLPAIRRRDFRGNCRERKNGR
jgi:hypothetical protein